MTNERILPTRPFESPVPCAEDRRIERYRQELEKLGSGKEFLTPPRSSSRKGRPPANSREAFDVFTQLRAAPIILTILDLFAEQSGLREHNDFAASCLPSNNRTPSSRTRASVISVGLVEALIVEIDRHTETILTVKVFCEEGKDLSWLSQWPEVQRFDTTLNGGAHMLSLTAEDPLPWLSSPDLSQAVTQGVRAIRSRRPRKRRLDWHNQWLWGAVESTIVETAPPLSTPKSTTDGAIDVSSPDVLRLTRQRTSQEAFRKLLLEGQAQRCCICGITRLEVLEAAHIVPHSRGGTASLDNGRLLCANHHRAYDADLYVWDGQQFTWNHVDPESTLGG